MSRAPSSSAETKTILALDTTTSINTVALCRATAWPEAWVHQGHVQVEVLAETVVACNRGHGERLLGTVDWVLKEAGLGLSHIDWLALSIGPGSFTGVRIGAATWKGIAFAQDLPLIAVPTLDAMTRLSLFQETTVCPLIDARMKEVFGAVYHFKGGVREKASPDTVCPVQDIFEGLSSPIVFLGDGATLYRQEILAAFPDALIATGAQALPHASAVALESVYLFAAGAEMDPALADPIYLRKSQAEINREKSISKGRS